MNVEPSGPAIAETEPKVKAATVTGAAIAAVILAFLSSVQTDNLLHVWPDWVTVLIGVAIAALGTWVAGYSAPHAARPDLPGGQR